MPPTHHAPRTQRTRKDTTYGKQQHMHQPTHTHMHCIPPHTTNKGRGVCCAVGWPMIGHSVVHGVGWRCWGVTGEGEGINPHMSTTHSQCQWKGCGHTQEDTWGVQACAGVCGEGNACALARPVFVSTVCLCGKGKGVLCRLGWMSPPHKGHRMATHRGR